MRGTCPRFTAETHSGRGPGFHVPSSDIGRTLRRVPVYPSDGGRGTHVARPAGGARAPRRQRAGRLAGWGSRRRRRGLPASGGAAPVLVGVVGRLRGSGRAGVPAPERPRDPMGRPECGQHLPARAGEPAVHLRRPRTHELLRGVRARRSGKVSAIRTGPGPWPSSPPRTSASGRATSSRCSSAGAVVNPIVCPCRRARSCARCASTTSIGANESRRRGP